MTYEWVRVGEGRKVFRKVREIQPARSDLPAPNFITDGVAPFKSMADGKMYDSKSVYYESLKRNECRIVESGE